MTAQELLAEFDRETTVTRRLIERIPPDKLDWKPHPKSTSMMGIGRHLAHMISYGNLALAHASSDIADRAPMPPTPEVADILAAFDRNVASVRALLAGQSDADLATTWALTYQGRQVLSSSRANAIQSMVVNHQFHHRGQLSVYLRLNDVPVPSIYGPSADEAQ